MFFEDRDILFKTYFAVNGSLLDVTVHIYLHKQASFQFISTKDFSENYIYSYYNALGFF